MPQQRPIQITPRASCKVPPNGYMFNSLKVNLALLPSKKPVLTSPSEPRPTSILCSCPCFNTYTVVLHFLIHLSPGQTASSLREETGPSLPVCTQHKRSAWHTGDAPCALCSLGHPGLDDCPRVMPSVTFTSPKCTGVCDKAYDHPVNK